MWLPLGNSFMRNHTVANITAGTFTNMRAMIGDSANGVCDTCMLCYTCLCRTHAVRYMHAMVCGSVWTRYIHSSDKRRSRDTHAMVLQLSEAKHI